MGSSKFKNVIIVLLVIAVAFLGTYSFFGKDGFKNTEISIQFIKDIQETQSSLSYYLGSTYSDTFGVYTKPEILSGKATTSNGEVIEIKDNEDKNLTSLINTNEKVEKSNNVSYKMLVEGVELLLDVDLSKYKGVEWYIQEDGIIKVDFDEEPDWWQKEFESFKVSK